jgi:hypothetical protein
MVDGAQGIEGERAVRRVADDVCGDGQRQRKTRRQLPNGRARRTDHAPQLQELADLRLLQRSQLDMKEQA